MTVRPPSRSTGPTTPSRAGLLSGLAAYGMWGFFPLYFPLLLPASALEVLAHRIVWSLVLCVLLVVATRAGHKVLALLRNPRQLSLLLAASALICVNWGVYIWAVNSDHVVEASLGYFINPLISVMLGVLLLSERMGALQWVAFGIAVVAVLVLTVGFGQPPWIALVLGFSFGGYGLCKKLAAAESIPSLTVETAVAFPFALACLGFLAAQGHLTFGHSSPGNTVLLLLAGVVTVVPLMLFNAAATRIPLSVLGIMQYITPVLQFLLGILVFSEHMPAVRWMGFALVWIALAVFTYDALRTSGPRPVVDAVPDL